MDRDRPRLFKRGFYYLMAIYNMPYVYGVFKCFGPVAFKAAAGFQRD